MANAKKNIEEMELVSIKVEDAHVRIKGISPLIYNAMSEKSRLELLVGGQKKNRAERAERAKHDVMTEYRASTYKFREVDGDKPTRLYFPTGSFKKAIQTAALRTPGATKTEVSQLCWITEDKVPIYGAPQLFMAIVRSANMGATPDIRTRAILPVWACEFTIRSVKPLIKTNDIIRLLATSGIIAGVGDWRQEKGSGSYGQFGECTDEEFAAIVKAGGRKAQDEALARPTFYDDETENLFAAYKSEMARRELKVAS